MPQELPLRIGAALPVSALPDFRDWLIEGARDLELQSFHPPAILDGDWQSLVAEARRHLDGFTGRLGMHGPFFGIDINAADPEIRSVVTRRLLQGVEICEALGATQMVIHSPFGAWHQAHRRLGAGPDLPPFLNIHATLDPVVARARDTGVELVLENIQDIDPGLRSEVIDSFDGDVLRASIDTGHAHLAHCTLGAPPVDAFVHAAGGRLAHVHLQDTDGQADRHWCIGEGSISWAGVFRTIAAQEAQPRLILELARADEIPRAMRYLEGLGLGC